LVPPSSAAVIEWSLTALRDGSTVVRVSIAVSPSRRDRLVLALGGGRWMSRRLRDGLDRLAARVAVRIGELRPPVHGS
jgi:MoxR-like ATPase